MIMCMIREKERKIYDALFLHERTCDTGYRSLNLCHNFSSTLDYTYDKLDETQLAELQQSSSIGWSHIVNIINLTFPSLGSTLIRDT
jgi:hypothetical protein